MRTTIAIGIIGLALFADAVVAQTAAERAQVLSDFQRSVAEYTHQQPGHEAALARQVAGKPAPRIFTLPVAMVFRQAISDAFPPPGGAAVMSGVGTVHRAVAPRPVPSPDLYEFPAVLSAVLPALPAPLEYRLIDNDLVIRDAEAGVIVDVLKNAIRTTLAQRQK